MNTTHDGTEETHFYVRRIDIEGATPLEVTGYGHRGKQWVPDHLTARWNHGEPITRINARGHVLKKDGTPGIARTSQGYATPASKGWDTPHYINAPEWLLALFGDSPHTTPEGASK